MLNNFIIAAQASSPAHVEAAPLCTYSYCFIMHPIKSLALMLSQSHKHHRRDATSTMWPILWRGLLQAAVCWHCGASASFLAWLRIRLQAVLNMVSHSLLLGKLSCGRLRAFRCPRSAAAGHISKLPSCENGGHQIACTSLGTADGILKVN